MSGALADVQPIACSLAPDATVRLTVFRGGVLTMQGEVWHATPDDIAEAVRNPKDYPGDKLKGDLWCPAEIEGDNRARRPDGEHPDGRRRTRAPEVGAIHALFVDYDEEPDFSIEWAHGKWGDLTHFAYTSASHMRPKGDAPAIPRGRVIVLLSRPVMAEELGRLAEWAGSGVFGRLTASETATAARGYFAPTKAPGGYEGGEWLAGTCLDVDAMLEAIDAATPAPAAPPAAAHRPAPTPRPTPRRSGEGCETVDQAVDAYRRDHDAQDWPDEVSDAYPCPMCGHRGCFHRHPENPRAWYCFSANHGRDGNEAGREVQPGQWSGDVLDIHAAGADRVEYLRRAGYLAERRSSFTPPLPDDLGDDPPVEAYDEAAVPGGPLIVKVPATNTLFVKTADGDWVPSDAQLLRGEIERQHPGLNLWSAEGKPLGVPAILDEHGQRCDSITYDLTRTQSRFNPTPDGGGELLIACGRRPYIEPEHSPEVARWLHLLFGPLEGKGLDWLATATDLRWPSACLYLYGPKSAGKGLLAAGLARLFGRKVTSYADITGQWNSALRDCPIVFLDEGCTPPANGSASLRTLTGEVQRPLLEKYRPAATLVGAVRVVVAANNVDALHLDDVQTRDDEAAVGERVLMITVPRSGEDRTKAGDFLADLGGRKATIGWVSDPHTGEPGPLTRHLAWLEATRRPHVKYGSRFAVHGEAGEWIRGAGLRAGMAQDVLIACIHALCGERRTWVDSHAPVWTKGREVLVATSRLHDRWEDLTRSRHTPSERRIGQALTALASGTSRTAPPVPHAPRIRVHHIPGDKLLSVSDKLGIGDPDKLRDALGLPFELPRGREVA